MKKTLSLVIPVYNEAARLEKTFQAMAAGFVSSQFNLQEIIFVNDGSTDTTKALLLEHRTWLEKVTKSKVVLVSYSKNRGKGYAVRKGMLLATGDYALLMDADVSTPITELKKLAPFVNKEIPVIIGTRKNGHSTVVVPQPIHRQIAGKIFTYLTQFILQLWITDFTCGFKLFSHDAAQTIFNRSKIERWGYDAEVLFLAKKFGFPIQEKALLWYNDKRTKVSFMRDVIGSLVELVKIRVNDYQGRYTTKADRDNLDKGKSSWAYDLYQS